MAKKQELEVEQPKPVTPWYQYTDWWARETVESAVLKIRADDIAKTDPANNTVDWVVLSGQVLRLLLDAYYRGVGTPTAHPSTASSEEWMQIMAKAAGRLDLPDNNNTMRSQHLQQQQVLRQSRFVGEFARELLLELVRTSKNGFSPRFVEEAWSAAEAFAARAQKPDGPLADDDTVVLP